jgi:BirA family transcriptional regulator, biotin operon repressor / biotin---[acetyl-CoA-carboxylase] ligase
LLEFVPQTGSTNADLAARLTRGEPVAEGHWLIAERQTAGRGRLGRNWLDGAGNFMGSTVVRPRTGDPPPHTLALLAGLVLHDLLSPQVAQTLTLKWPNDLLAGEAKLAGILLERAGDVVVVGIGVNLAKAPKVADRATIALGELGVAQPLEAFAEGLARHFAADLDRWRSYGLGPLVNRWNAAGHPPGTRLVADDGRGDLLEGAFAGLTAEGALQLRLADGSLRVIHAGETRIV